MNICDLTQAYTESSGGIRTYIDAKRKYLSRNGSHQNVMKIPAERDSFNRKQNLTTDKIKAPLIPGCKPYRFIFNLYKVNRILAREKPDIIELGSPYLLPWAAFFHRLFNRCGIIGYYHTDYPTAYVKTISQKILGNHIAHFAEYRAKLYASLIFNQCDRIITSSNVFYEKLYNQLKKPAYFLPLGVDHGTLIPNNAIIVSEKNLELLKMKSYSCTPEDLTLKNESS